MLPIYGFYSEKNGEKIYKKYVTEKTTFIKG